VVQQRDELRRAEGINTFHIVVRHELMRCHLLTVPALSEVRDEQSNCSEQDAELRVRDSPIAVAVIVVPYIELDLADLLEIIIRFDSGTRCD
jgi:hypothetical protein